MGVTINFKAPNGPPITTNHFEQGETVEIYGKVTGSLGVGDSIPVTVSIENGDYELASQSVSSSWLGNYSATLTMPMLDTKATVYVTGHWSVSGGDEVKSVPIAIGTATPGGQNYTAFLSKYGIWLAAGAVGVVAIYIALKPKAYNQEQFALPPGNK